MPTARTNLKRPALKLPQKKSYIILHEPGAMGEYFAWIRRVLEHPHIHLEAMGEHPLETALSLLNTERILANSQDARADEVWCVWDSDNHPGTDVNSLAEKFPSMRLAPVSPSFEHWILLHFENSSSAMTAMQVRSRLNEVLDSYNGSLRNREPKLLGHFESARARSTEEVSQQNIFGLIDSIRESQRAFLGDDVARQL